MIAFVKARVKDFAIIQRWDDESLDDHFSSVDGLDGERICKI